MTRLMIVTGLSGSGKSVALHTLEDDGYHCIDNLPSELLLDVIDRLLTIDSSSYDKLAIGVDMRSEGKSAFGLLRLLKTLRERDDLQLRVLFLDTDRRVLTQRFSETRRRHPLSNDDSPLATAIDTEAQLLEAVKESADTVIDTSALNLHELRGMVRQFADSQSTDQLLVVLQSFGFKRGNPMGTDFMFDVRCLPNPYWQPDIRHLSGKDQAIIDFLSAQPMVNDMFEHIHGFLEHWIPQFNAENRAYLTVSIGCTGGRHRSVYLTDRLAAAIRESHNHVAVRHREFGS
jgi:RNase adapter protein RapZ